MASTADGLSAVYGNVVVVWLGSGFCFRFLEETLLFYPRIEAVSEGVSLEGCWPGLGVVLRVASQTVALIAAFLAVDERIVRVGAGASQQKPWSVTDAVHLGGEGGRVSGPPSIAHALWRSAGLSAGARTAMR